MSPSGDVEAEVVYANYGTPEDFEKLEQMNIDVRGKIVIVRYGQNFRGVKVFVAQEHGAAGVIIYSDPDGRRLAARRQISAGAVASRHRRAARIGRIHVRVSGRSDDAGNCVHAVAAGFASAFRRPSPRSCRRFPSTPLSYRRCLADSASIWRGRIRRATGRARCRLPITWAPGRSKVKMHLKQDYQYPDDLGRDWQSQGQRDLPDEWVVAGNHRDAWVYGAVDPNSGTAAMLESGTRRGRLLKSGWKPKRTIVFASWDAEEEGLIGSTEWGEQHEAELRNAAAVFQYGRRSVGPEVWCVGGSEPEAVYSRHHKGGCQPARAARSTTRGRRPSKPETPQRIADGRRQERRMPGGPGARAMCRSAISAAAPTTRVFLQHLGVPSTDISSSGPYGVYHSAFDDFTWFKKFGDPDFRYEQQMARVLRTGSDPHGRRRCAAL